MASARRKPRRAGKKHGHQGCVIWFTGLSGCGKSTLANLVDHTLHARGLQSFVLDGDNVRFGLNASSSLLKERHGEEFAKRFGLGFSSLDREENIRRIGAVAELFAQAGLITLTAFISPYRSDRDGIRARLSKGDFVEVFVKAPLEVCERRDPKGLYKKARAGELKISQALTIHTKNLKIQSWWSIPRCTQRKNSQRLFLTGLRRPEKFQKNREFPSLKLLRQTA